MSPAPDEAIRHQLGMSTTQWAQVLDVLIDTAEAEAAYPMLVKRLRRLREARGATKYPRSSLSVILGHKRATRGPWKSRPSKRGNRATRRV